MTNAHQMRKPAEAGETSAEECARAWARWSFASRSQQEALERTPVYRTLSPTARHVLDKIAAHFGRRDFCWPGQRRLMEQTGLSERAIRDAIREIEASGILSTVRMRRREGGWQLYYRLTPMMKQAIAAQVAALGAAYGSGDPEAAEAARAAARAKRLGRGGGFRQQAPVSLPAPNAAEALKRDLEASSCEDAPEAEPAAAESAPREAEAEHPNQQQEIDRSGVGERGAAPGAAVAAPPPAPPVTAEDEAVAKEALAYHANRKRPGQTPPSWWDRPAVLLVATRVSQEPGTREEKIAAQRAAVDGAFLTSKDRPPTLRYVWGEQAHYLEHVARGRAARAKAERQLAQEAAKRAASEARREGQGAPSGKEGSGGKTVSEADTASAPLSPEEHDAVLREAMAKMAEAEREQKRKDAAEREQHAREEAQRREVERRQRAIDRQRAQAEAFAIAAEMAEETPARVMTDEEARAETEAELRALMQQNPALAAKLGPLMRPGG